MGVGRIIPRKNREDARRMARAAYIEAGGDVKKAKAIFKQKIQGYGNILTMLTIAAVMIQIAYTLFKFWKDSQVSIPPEEPTDDEPF